MLIADGRENNIWENSFGLLNLGKEEILNKWLMEIMKMTQIFKYNLIVTLYPWIPRIYYYFFLSWATG